MGFLFRVSEAISAPTASKSLCFHAFSSTGTPGQASTVPALSCSSRSYSYLAISVLHANKYTEGEKAQESQRVSNLPVNFSRSATCPFGIFCLYSFILIEAADLLQAAAILQQHYFFLALTSELFITLSPIQLLVVYAYLLIRQEQFQPFQTAKRCFPSKEAQLIISLIFNNMQKP